MKKVLKYAGVLLGMIALIAVLVCGIQLILFYRDTLPEKGIAAYCAEQSKRGATEFVPVEDDSKSGFYFYVAADGDAAQGQELYLFQKESFMRREFNRYTLYASSLNTVDIVPESPVGVLYFTHPREFDKEDPLRTLYFFSDNQAQIASCICEIYMDNSTAPITNVLPSGTPFLLSVGNIGKSEDLELVVNSAKFLGAEGETVWTYVNPDRRAIVLPNSQINWPSP